MVTGTLIVDSSPLFRAGLQRVLDETPFKVKASVRSLNELEAGTSELAGVEIALVRATPTEHTPQDLAAWKARLSLRRLVLLIDALPRPAQALELIDSPLDGVLITDTAPDALSVALELVMLGERVYPSAVVRALMNETQWTVSPAALQTNLTDREEEIARLLARGHSNKVIARELDITEGTVKVHLKSLLRKIGVHNRTQAAVWALHNGLSVPAEAQPAPPFTPPPRAETAQPSMRQSAASGWSASPSSPSGAQGFRTPAMGRPGTATRHVHYKP